jgi:hypothetical protein
MQPTWNNTGVAHENGDVEQSHHRFKEALDQALRVRGSRDFATRATYDHFVQDLIHKRNQTRTARFTAEKVALRPLPAMALSPCKELRVMVSRFSTITVAGIMRDKLRKVNPPPKQPRPFGVAPDGYNAALDLSHTALRRDPRG